MCKILLWSVEYVLNQSSAKFGRISNSIEISPLGRAPCNTPSNKVLSPGHGLSQHWGCWIIYNDVTWTSCNLKSPVILFNSLCGPTTKKEKSLHYWPAVRGIHLWPINSQGPVSSKKLPFDDVIMYWKIRIFYLLYHFYQNMSNQDDSSARGCFARGPVIYNNIKHSPWHWPTAF